MPSTYTPINSTTLTTDTSSVTFSSIPATYTDLIAVIQTRVASATIDYFSVRYNGDTGTNYSFTYMANTGSARFTNLSQQIIGWATSNSENSTSFAPIILQILDYSNTTTYKTSLSRSGASDMARVDAQVNLWRSTNAINSIVFATWGAGTFGANNMRAGTTISLYGIKAA